VKTPTPVTVEPMTSTPMTPTQAILWQIGWRNRWILLGAAAYLVVAIALSHLLSSYMQTHYGEQGRLGLGMYLAVPCALVIVIVLMAFSLARGSAGETTPPSHMLVLPIRTVQLVAAPMLVGSLFMIAIWLAIVWLILRPTGIVAPICWPAAALVLFLTAFQAISWTPFAQVWMSLVATLAVTAAGFLIFLAGILAGVVDPSFSRDSAFLTGGFSAFVPVAFAAAVAGMAMKRRGDTYDWKQWDRWMAWWAQWRKPSQRPFASTSAAQVWFECRSIGWYSPLFVGGTMLLLPFLLLETWNQPDQTIKMAQFAIGLPLLMVTVTGSILGSVDGLGAKPPHGPFLFTRPLSSAALVRAKLWMGLLSIAATWLVMLPVATMILFRPGCIQALSQWAASVPPWKVVLLPWVAGGAIFALSWKQLVESYWVPLTGREWLVGVFTGSFVFIILGGVGAGLWLALHPQHVAMASAGATWLMAVVVGIKAVVAVCVVRELDRARLLSRGFVAAMGGLWIAIVVGLLFAAFNYLPSSEISRAQVALGIVLTIPFSRLMGTPLAVEWNRHR
jgi:hypothetical protein